MTVALGGRSHDKGSAQTMRGPVPTTHCCTRDQGRRLACRFALAGNQVIIASHGAERARAAAAEIVQETGPNLRGLANRDMARATDVVIAVVPWEGHKDLVPGA